MPSVSFNNKNAFILSILLLLIIKSDKILHLYLSKQCSSVSFCTLYRTETYESRPVYYHLFKKKTLVTGQNTVEQNVSKLEQIAK